MNVKVLRAIDKYGIGAVTALAGPFVKILSSSGELPGIRRVLLIKLWAIGDSVLTLPLIHAIRTRFPESEIDVLCHPSNRPVFDNSQGEITRVIEFTAGNTLKLWRKYDVCFDTEPYLNLSSILSAFAATRRVGFRNRLRWLFYHHTVDTDTRRHAVEKYLDMGRFFGIDGRKELVPLGYSPDALRSADRILRENGISAEDICVGFCASVGPSVHARQWPKGNFREVAKRLLEEEKGLKIVLFGTEADRKRNEFIRDGNPRIIDLSGKATLEETFHLVRSMGAFLSNDTGPMHIAAAQGVRTLGLFGPSSPALWAPYGEGNAAIWHGPEVCEYSPCNLPHKGLVPECYLEGDRKDICIRSIGTEEVIEKYKELAPPSSPVPFPRSSTGSTR